MFHRLRHGATVVILIALLLLFPSTPAYAHGGLDSPIQTFTQEIGPHELAVTLELPPAVPAPLLISILPQQDMGEATITLRTMPLGLPFEGAPQAQVTTQPGAPTVYSTRLDINQAGPWNLEVRVDSPQGGGVALIPFTITPAPLAPYTIPLLASFSGLIVLMLSSIVMSSVARQQARSVPEWLNRGISYGIFGCAIAAGIFGAQQAFTNTAAVQTDMGSGASMEMGRPHANLALATAPAQPQVAEPFMLRMQFSDGGTGMPVDDIVSHHEALLHLLVISEDGSFFEHRHPARVGPGQYELTMDIAVPGRYTAYAEIERMGGGTQILQRSFKVVGSAPAQAAAPTAGLGTHTIDDLQVTITSSRAAIEAGRQTTLTFSFYQDGAPVEDIQPWLGMAGHLVARSDDGAIFGHIHAAAQMVPSSPQPSTVRFGPDIRFAYTFPQAGQYQLWAQFQHQNRIITVPFALEVSSSSATAAELSVLSALPFNPDDFLCTSE